MASSFPERRLPVEYFYLGADMGGKKFDKLPIRRELENDLLKAPFYLMVGTIQPHKGHLTVLEAFEQMWKEGFSGKLSIVGRLGGKGDEVMKRLRTSKYFGKTLFVYHDANDTELDLLYRHTEALVLASYAEGFGLPLVEAMDLSVPVIASDLPVFREIGGDYPNYFVPGSSVDLFRVIRKREKGGGSGKERGIRKWMAWDEAVLILSEKLISCYKEAKIQA